MKPLTKEQLETVLSIAPQPDGAPHANRVKACREALDLSQLEFGKATGFRQGRVCEFERGQKFSRFTLTDARKIAGIVGMTVDDLFPPAPPKKQRKKKS